MKASSRVNDVNKCFTHFIKQINLHDIYMNALNRKIDEIAVVCLQAVKRALLILITLKPQIKHGNLKDPKNPDSPQSSRNGR